MKSLNKSSSTAALYRKRLKSLETPWFSVFMRPRSTAACTAVSYMKSKSLDKLDVAVVCDPVLRAVDKDYSSGPACSSSCSLNV